MKPTAPAEKVFARYRDIDRVSPADIRRMYEIFRQYYGNTDLDTFLADMSRKTGVFMIRRRSDRQIVGFSTVALMDLHLQGKKVKGVFSGDTIIEREYWGSRALVSSFFLYLVRVVLRYPMTPVFWLLISKGYKTYLLLANNFFRFYPHPERQYTEYEPLVQEYSDKLFPGYYDPNRKVLDFGESYQFLNDDVAAITAEMRERYPRIAFFEECNPDWHKGNELPCVGRAGVSDVFRYVFRLINKVRSDRLVRKGKSRTPVALPELHNTPARSAQ